MVKPPTPPLSYSGQPTRFKTALKSGAKSGFALIATISVMALIVMIALGMVSLSTSVARSSQNDKAMAEAQANARLALMIAIGKLQMEMGPDMRISAPADIIDPSNPSLVGVWRSWEGSDHEDSSQTLAGRPIAPAYSSKRLAETSDPDGRFLSWLVSGGDQRSTLDSAATLVMKSPSGDSVPLLSSGSLAAGDTREVHVVPTLIEERGSYAWWMSGENQKAHLPKPYSAKVDDVANWGQLLNSHSAVDPEVFGLEGLLDDASPADKVVTLGTTALLPSSTPDSLPQRAFHDLSVTARGLLTNVATGGWRKDLSLLSEKWEDQPPEDLELFQLSYGEHVLFTRPEAEPSADGTIPASHRPSMSLFYPWSDFRESPWTNQHLLYQRPPVSSWENLINHITLYKNVDEDLNAFGVPAIDSQSWGIANTNDEPLNTFNAFHKTYVIPQIARVQMILSHYATDDYQNVSPNRLRPAVLYTPVVTFWNPFNFEIRIEESINHLGFDLSRALPIALKYDGLASEFWAVQKPDKNNEATDYPGLNVSSNQRIRLRIPIEDLVLQPGQTKVFSPRQGELTDETYANTNQNAGPYIQMEPGVRLGGGYYYALDRLLDPSIPGDGVYENKKGGGIIENITAIHAANPDALSLDPSFRLKAEARFNVAGYESENSGLDAIWSLGNASGNSHGRYFGKYDNSEADALYPPLDELTSTSLAQCAENPVPFLSMTYGSRTASGTPLTTKGMVQSSLVVNFSESGANVHPVNTYPGMKNMINTSWDFGFLALYENDSHLPNVDVDGTNSGYIVTGTTSGDGIDHMSMIELPSRPLASIVELTHWHLRGLNQVPPHAQNIIGNSDATPLIPANNVVDPINNLHVAIKSNEQQDDSYCANHMLFDDWFFSSIAPEPDLFGPKGKTLEENYLEFLMESDPLANTTYRPIRGDSAADMSIANQLYNENVEPTNSWRTIASRLEVEGMFNINSTSVKAWRALLGHARNQKIPYQDASGNVKLSDETDFAMPRVISTSHGEAGVVPADNEATSEFPGYRVFTGEMLDDLAESIVAQVRLRGPFLSLSEFVNRQLSDDQDLAIGGAIQVALNQLAADPALNPFKVMESLSVPSLASPPGTHDYAFPAAAVGHNTYGLPGWPRQADVLRPLAPIISARDDTFTIRTYGDYRGPDGKILARAWCEAVVRRGSDFVDPSDAADVTTLPTSVANQQFGRRFQIISFRWLNENEV